MFNLARMRDRKIPDDLKKYEAVYKTRSLDVDATKVAFIMAREYMAESEVPTNLLAVLRAVPYWKFVERYHTDYLKNVLRRAKMKAKKIVSDFKDNPGMFPMPKPKGEEGGGMGGGMPGMEGPPPGGPMASSDAKIVTAATTRLVEDAPGGMYLKKKTGNGDWKLSSTWGVKIISGGIPILMPDGSMTTAGISDDDTLVPRNSRSVQEVMRMEERMPEALVETVVETCKKNGVGIGVQEAVIFVNGAKKSGYWYFLAFNALKSDLSMAYLMHNADAGGDIIEPQVTTDLRKNLGAVMYPYVKRLMDAIVIDRVIAPYKEWRHDPQDWDLLMPTGMSGASEAGKQLNEEAKQRNIEEISRQISESARNPQFMVTGQDILASFDMASLVMTAVSQNAPLVARNRAIRRLLMIIEHHWPVYRIRPVTEAEIANMADAIEMPDMAIILDALKVLVAASKMDDRQFLEEYIYANDKYPKIPDIKESLARLAGGQKREDVIKAYPDMALGKYGVIEEVFYQLDPKTATGTFRKSLAYFNREFHGDKPDLGKLHQALYESGDPQLLSAMLDSSETEKFATFYALEHGDADRKYRAKTGLVAALRRNSLWDVDMTEKFLLAANLIKSAKTDGPSDVDELIKSIPAEEAEIEYLPLLGKDLAKKYIQVTRKTLDGKPLPQSWEIHSLPADPLGLAKAYESMGDMNAVLVLFATGLEQFNQNDAQLDYALRYMYNAMIASGDKQVIEWANQALRKEGVHLGDKGMRRLVAPGSIAAGQIKIDHVQDLIEAGDIPSAAKVIGYLYRYKPRNALDILGKMQPDALTALTPMLPPGMMAALHQPVKPQPIEASILPGGEILVKKGSVYEMTAGGKKTSFVASPKDAVRIAMSKTGQGTAAFPAE